MLLPDGIVIDGGHAPEVATSNTAIAVMNRQANLLMPVLRARDGSAIGGLQFTRDTRLLLSRRPLPARRARADRRPVATAIDPDLVGSTRSTPPGNTSE